MEERSNITVHEIERAEISLVKLVQKLEFSKELSNLNQSKEESKNSTTVSLNPFLDLEGIVRVGGRLKMANLDYNQKCPILLPGKHAYTDLIILYEHERTLHGGVHTVLSAVRTRFWLINAKNPIKKIIRRCIVCFKARAIGFTPMMGQLPGPRVNPSRPFSTCGIDFAGPFIIKEGTLRSRKLVKVYVCIFICFSTKAVHLELAGDLSTPVFLNALKIFFFTSWYF
ncbi:hypothetical protein NQ314_008445 [Rhamnusium bicolor]|uniref:Integrase zinc-binding domain-containing protein n=1 Tax=Rhamnusium bicolor TaxID=1586634 RepID=A0AAV8YB26_9CUCU|nr:hypothetical protein NQ314_008445 [Rhamnusium bicolor]